MKNLIIILSILGLTESANPQSSVFQRIDFEEDLPPFVTWEMTTDFDQQPDVNSITETGSSKAFGFGISSHGTVNKCALIIYILDPVQIESISFREIELNGNRGSSGKVYIDDHEIAGSSFGRPGNDGIADNTFRERSITVNQMATYYIYFMVDNIADTSEIYIDDIVITTNPRHGEVIFENDLSDENDINYFKGHNIKTGNYKDQPYYHSVPLFDNYSFGFGRSTCTAYCQDNNKTSVKITLPDERLIETVSFKAAELYSNWGSRGYVYLDGSQLANSHFHRFPDNDSTADDSYRLHEMKAYRYAKDIVFTVNDITDTSELFIDDVIITSIPEEGDILLEENFEDSQLDERIESSTKGAFLKQPATQQVDTFGIKGAYGFGKTNCPTNCLQDYTSSLVITFPVKTPVFFISFKEFEINGNWGSRGMLLVDDTVIYGGDFQRWPLNDNKSDTNYRHHAVPVFKEINKIEFRVWDITNVSEIFIDDIVIKGIPSSPSSLKQNSEDRQINIFPNPASNILNINLQPENLPSTISIYSLIGLMLFQTEVNTPDVVIDLKDYNAGIYILRIKTQGKITKYKILKY